MNLVMVYHPNCKHSRNFKPEYLKLAEHVVYEKLNVNVFAINDGFAPEVKRSLPLFSEIQYYPTILLYRNDDKNTVIEFNPSSKEEQYAFNRIGIFSFLKDYGARNVEKSD
jgi:thiol-disulfide isomerase/thioredoxin